MSPDLGRNDTLRSAVNICRAQVTRTMASRHNDQVHLSSCLSDGNHGRSKAQTCLKKILDFLFHSPKKSHEMRIESGFGNGIDLNLRLGGGGSSMGDLEYERKEVVSACSGVGEDKSPQRECDVQKEPLQEEEESSSEITHLQEMEINPAPPEQQSEDEEHSNKVKNGKRKVTEEESKGKGKGKGKGYLDLLVEAARLVSGGLQDDDGPTLKQLSQAGGLSECNTVEAVPQLELKADTNWFDCYGGIEVDMSPLVRSKRGRNQVLPSRFRDSVLEPLTTRVTSTPKSSRLTAAKPKSRK